MPCGKLFDLPAFTSAWDFVINNVEICDFVLGWLTLQSISKDHKRAVCKAFNTESVPPRERPRSPCVTEDAVPLEIRGCF